MNPSTPKDYRESTSWFILGNRNLLTTTQFPSSFYFHLLSWPKYIATAFVLPRGFLFNILVLLNTPFLISIRSCQGLKMNFFGFMKSNIVLSSLGNLWWILERIRMLDFCNQAILFLVIFLVIWIDDQRYLRLHITLLLLHLHKMENVLFQLMMIQINLCLMMRVWYLP